MTRSAVLPLFVAIVTMGQQRLEVAVNVRADFAVPTGETAVRRILVRQTDGSWQPLRFEQQGKTLHFRIDPDQTGGRTQLLIDPPDDMVLDDRTAPRLGQFRVDGKPVQPVPIWTQPPGTPPPKRLEWRVTDPGSGIDRSALRVTLDGQPMPADRLAVTDRKDGLSLAVDLAKLPLGRHELAATVIDRSLDRNSLDLQAKIDVFDPTNLLRADPGTAKVAVDSHYSNYPDVAPLIDGVRQLPGKSAGNDVTWASAEDGTPHWVELTLRQEATVREVAIYWAREISASRTIEIQVPDGDTWRTVGRADSLPAKQAVTVAFPPIKTKRFRVYQPANGGSEARPGLMWITEIEAR
jgi:hypothetical protein